MTPLYQYVTEELPEIIHANTSKRNFRQVYPIPFENEIVILPIKLEKLIVSDVDVYKTIDNEFNFFTPSIDVSTEAFSLQEGTIFRPTGQGILNPSEYEYYIINNGSLLKIPNYKSVEVLLAERERSLDSIQIIEEVDFNELLAYDNGNKNKSELDAAGISPTPINPSTSSDLILQWSPNLELKSLSQQFDSLLVLAGSTDTIVNSAKDASKGAIDFAIAEKELAEAEAENLTNDQTIALSGLSDSVTAAQEEIITLTNRINNLE